MTLTSTTTEKSSTVQRVTFLSRATQRLMSVCAFLSVGFAAAASADPIDIGHSVQASSAQIEHSTIIVERLSDGQIWVSNPDRAQRRFAPASSAKIPHTLIALEGGLATPTTVFRWDGVARGVRVWNQDHSLASAFQHSVVWVYQEIARTAGQNAMSEGLKGLGYGNMRVGSVDQLTTYWLDNTLRISAAEQVDFLSRLALGQLPLSEATYTAARELMVSDERANWVMRSKTGWFFSKDSMDIGWHVGWLECPNETYVFALNMDMPDTTYLSRRTEITYSVLEDLGAFGCG